MTLEEKLDKQLEKRITKQKIIDKLNEGQESDVQKYTWETIPESLKRFWINFYKI